MGSICILDGDQEHNKNLNNHIIVLPGKCSPEDLLFSYADKLLEENSKFWTDSYIISLGYSTVYYLTNIKSRIDKCKSDIEEKKSMNITTNGMRREGNKKIFKDDQPFFTLLIKYWINDLENLVKINDFYKDLNILFKKVAEINNINSSEWNI